MHEILKNDLISIVMPVFNGKHTISKAVDSVLGQTYSNWELIIVDDGSTDGTASWVAENYKDKRIRIYKKEINEGVAKARNFGIDRARGRFLAFLDADDSWKKKKLEKQLDFMLKNDFYFTYTSYDIYEEGIFIKSYVVPKKLNYLEQLKGSKIGTLTVMIDLCQTGKIKMKNIGHEDYVMWLDLLSRHGEAHGIQQSLAIYDNGGEGISSNKLKSSIWQFNIYRKILGFSFIKSVYYFIHYAVNGVRKHRR